MVADIPVSFWPAASTAVIACLSGIMLSVQRGSHHKSKIALATTDDGNKYAVPLKFDEQFDPSVPFTDQHRLTRLNFGTLVLLSLTAYDLFLGVNAFSKTDAHSYLLIAQALTVVSWTYIFTLTLVSRCYRLPNAWGWVLNVHLFILFSVMFCGNLYQWFETLRSTVQVSWMQAIKSILSVFIGMDMVYTTGSTERSSPYVDENDRKVVAYDVSSIFSYLYFNWITPVVMMVYRKKEVTDDDLPALPPLFRAYNLFYIFKMHNSKSLLWRIVLTNKKPFVIQAVLAVLVATCNYIPQYFMNRVLVLLQDTDADHRDNDFTLKGFLLVTGLSLTVILIGIMDSHMWFWSSSNVLVRSRAMLNIEIYHKTLRRLNTAFQSSEDDKEDDQKKKETDDDQNNKEADTNEDNASTGTIVNLMSTDSSRVSEYATWWFFWVESPIELAVGITFLYQLLGVSCLLGLLVMVVTLPLNHFSAKLFARTQDRLMSARDKRVSLMNEALQGVRQIKFFAWEKKWENRIMKSRATELKHLRMTYICDVLFSFLWQATPLLVTIISFWSYTALEGKQLTAPVAFTALVVFNELRFALNVIPDLFIELLQALISVRRIEAYLAEGEITAVVPQSPDAPINIHFEHATVGWSTPTQTTSDIVRPETSTESSSTHVASESFILKDITAHFPNSQLSLISGATGSGKTLMMLSLLGETVIISGTVASPRHAVLETVDDHFMSIEKIPAEEWILDHAVAYVSQTPWLQNASIRDNILFGLPYDEQRYTDTLYACALEKDLEILEDGDMTEIGEKGITLSGGQKARVSLARAVYSRAKNVLMDDVLSAVDAHTAKHVYDKCLTGPLMQGRTRILITHQVKLCLSGSAYIVHLEGGRVGVSGSPAELRQSGQLASILDSEETEDSTATENPIEDTIYNPESETPRKRNDKTKKSPRVLVEEETRATGTVKWRLYTLYFKTVGKTMFWLILAVLIFGARGLDIVERWWLKQWAEAASANALEMIRTHINAYMPAHNAPPVYSLMVKDTINVMEDRPADYNLNYYLGMYALILLSNIVVSTVRFGFLYWRTLGASRKLYGDLLRRVLRAPLRFFDTTPIGRILNRFSKDFDTIDSTIPMDMIKLIIQWIAVVSSLLTVAAVLPVFAIPMLVVVAANIAIGRIFISASRELKRMDSVTRSPLFTHFTETIVGISTIRAFGATQRFMQEMLQKIDKNARVFCFAWLVNRWMATRLATIGACVNFITGMLIILNVDKLDVSSAGFCFSFVMAYNWEMFWAIRRYTSMEMSFNSMERVVEFMEIEQEAPAITELRPPPDWPIRGEIQVENLQVRYAADLEPVLHGISFHVNAKEKIGVVGRTGSGKSTLALSFFRFVEATQGRIIIDDVDIADIGTEDLRSNLTIIPQDPTLFSGTLRSNMDPFDQFTDEDIFAALRRVELLPSDDAEVIENVNANVFQNLDTAVSEGGKNFSQGQRQLLCLARALLKRTTIVLMDEATASVDFETDKAIQKTMTTEFADCTILCIAHRLHTIIGYDRILVLDAGKIIEFASPLELINDFTSAFHKMCKNCGEFENLLALAKSTHELVDVS
ncbi:P-loop containing nucleoside triphosphate hydrolase protein [Radiomyces spectabilis]|uniref:P-loop containing nucleoside triphosphate hydrolase protein n=1 Tax=Radiomyces spectabilis TaxID=64574 RepID=UPI00221E77AE|nr:P-loop containing nucleoside triphosphate hydrolase protein [Radiomyces spectabilis]KAI8388117.1 P-loop containing nucleoside triphosphate hydrolase protein [Radiomyces spectabilis]